MSLARPLATFLLTSIVAVAFLFLLEHIRPEVLLVGNVTVDLVDGNRTVGGAVTNAAALIEAQGKRACVVTTAGEDAELSIFANHDLYVIPDKETLTFAHSYTWWGHRRVLHVTARPSITLDLKHVPLMCRLAKTVMVMPLMPEDINVKAFLHWRNAQNRLLPQKIGFAAQGLQRNTEDDGKVYSYTSPSPILMDGLGDGVSLFLSDVESDPWPEADMMKVVASCDRVLITQGEKGADEFIKTDFRRHVDAAKIEKVVDTNGAGDTYATAYMLALAARSVDPAWDAARAAAQIVTKPQSCKPWCSATDEFLRKFITTETSNVRRTRISSLAVWIDAARWSWLVTPSVLNEASEP